MEFSYYDTNQIKKLDIKIGSKWSEIKTGNVYINSIFKNADNGDGIVQENEFSIVLFLLKKADSLIKKSAGDGVVDNDELWEMTKHFKDNYKMSELKNGRIDTIDPNDYTLESLKKRYPADKYDISEGYDGIIIKDKSADKIVLRVWVGRDSSVANKNVIVITENEKSPNKIVRSYNEDGVINFYDGLDGKRHQPIADDFVELLESKTNAYSKTELLKKVNSMLEKINSQNIIMILGSFNENTKKNLDEAIKSSPLLKNNHFIREKILNHLNKCLEEFYDYKHDFKNENSQVVNKFHTGDSYTVDCKNEKMTIINNKTGKQKTLDLNKLVKNLPLQYQVEIKKYLSEISGEVLMDLSIETDSFGSLQDCWLDRLYSKIWNVAGCYNPQTDSISLGGYGHEEDQKTDWTGSIVHELGHALDFTDNKCLSCKYDEFKEAFKNGREAFIKAGHTPCTSSKTIYFSIIHINKIQYS